MIDTPDDDIAKAKRYRGAFEHPRAHVLPMRETGAEREKQNNSEKLAADPTARINKHDANFLKRWWQLGYRRKDMLSAIVRVDRYAALSRVAVENKPPVWVFVDASIRPGDALQVFDFDDEYSVGILSSDVHQLWFRERATAMKKDPRYTPDTVVDSFPWPQNVTPQRAGAVATAMKAILDYREELMRDGLSLNDMYATFADEGQTGCEISITRSTTRSLPRTTSPPTTTSWSNCSP